jgi:hypothetical protein
MDSIEAINSLSEVSGPDVGSVSFVPGGTSYPEYQPNACRLGNEALDGVEVASHRSNGSSILLFFEFQNKANTEVSLPRERGIPVMVPEDPVSSILTSSKTKEKSLLKDNIASPNFTTKSSFNWNSFPHFVKKKQEVSPMPAGKIKNFGAILNEESWGVKSHQQFPKVKTREKLSPPKKKAIPGSEAKDEDLIITKSDNSQNSKILNRSSEMHSIDKISKISIQEPPNYDEVLKPIEKGSIFSDKISIINNRERDSDKQTTKI